MPLKKERPGLFRGRANNFVAWYVVSPDAADPNVAAQQWREAFAASNSATGRRIVGIVLGWIGFLAIFGGAVALLWSMGQQGWYGWPIYGGLVWLVGLAAGAMLGGWVHELIAPTEYAMTRMTKDVMPLDEAVVEWADDQVPVPDLWQLNYSLHAVQQFGSADFSYTEGPEGEPQELVGQLVNPLLAEHAAHHRARLKEIAGRLGYPLEDSTESDRPDHLGNGGSSEPPAGETTPAGSR
jgi:hypothetical protein